METKTILIHNDLYNDRPFYIKKLSCHNVNHLELCDKCRLRFKCYSVRARGERVLNDADIILLLSDIFRVNKEHKNYLEADFMMEEYMFGHMLDLTEHAMIKVWMSNQ